MAFFSHVYRRKFCRPNARWFFQLIVICFIHTWNIKVKNPMDFWLGLEKPGAHCELWPLVALVQYVFGPLWQYIYAGVFRK